MVPSDENRAKIDEWVATAPDNRLVETAQHGDLWTTLAMEDGDVVYEETEHRDEPELKLLAAWCARQGQRVQPRPPVKTGGAPAERLARNAQT